MSFSSIENEDTLMAELKVSLIFFTYSNQFINTLWEDSGSVVECLTRERGHRLEPNQLHCVMSLSKTH